VSQESQRTARVFILLTILVGAGVVVWALLHLQPVPWLGPIVLGTCALIAELYPVRLSEEGTVSVAAALDFAAVILFPPQVSILIVAFAAGFSDIIGRVPPIRVLFNTAQLAIAATLASKVYSLGPGGVFTFQTHALWGLISGLTFLFTNSLLTCTVIALTQGHRPIEIWLQGNREMLLHDIALYPIGMLVALVYTHDVPALILFILPMVIIYVSFRNNVLVRRQAQAVLETLADIIDCRDPYTAEHSRRVAEYAAAIAWQMGLSDEDCQMVQASARIHDLGKVTWRDDLLFKPGKLTAEEMERVREHPATGARIVEGLAHYQKGVPLIRHHHEWIDGSGYPDGLKGDTIPLGARILAVADAYDAMTSDRPYRKALSEEEALRRLVAGAGTQFDGEVVQAFLDWVDSRGEELHGAAREEAAAIRELPGEVV
jgi:HD-GYP domain-containing protein (c-di-GMP phosphodiesterase class II)